METISPDYETQLRDEVINRILMVSSVATFIAFSSAQLRALDIGWHARDALQFLVTGLIVILALNRRKMNEQNKALFLVILFSLGGFSGAYTLGMLGGTIFIFPTAAVVIAVFYPSKTTLIYIGLSLLLCCLIAVNFCSESTVHGFSPELLMTSYNHWFVYIVCIATFFAVMQVAIYSYRRMMKTLIDKISQQNHELEKRNDELVKASDNIKRLSGLLPICASCKKIRDDKGYWNQIEEYIRDHSEASFSHGICPECMKTLYPDVEQS